MSPAFYIAMRQVCGHTLFSKAMGENSHLIHVLTHLWLIGLAPRLCSLSPGKGSLTRCKCTCEMHFDYLENQKHDASTCVLHSVFAESDESADLYITYSGSHQYAGIHKFGKNRVGPSNQFKGICMLFFYKNLKSWCSLVLVIMSKYLLCVSVFRAELCWFGAQQAKRRSLAGQSLCLL